MAWNGAGVFNRLYSWTADKAAAINITASRTDADTNDIVTQGLGNCLTRDGQGQPTANLPMANFRHTTVGDGVARTDYTSLGQTQDGKINWVAAAGTGDALTAAYAPAITALVDGQLCYVRAGAANTITNPTFSPNGLTARTITKVGGTSLVAGDIFAAGHELILRYKLSSTTWELLNPAGLASGLITSAAAGAGVGPTLDLFRDKASPAVSDFIGSVDFNARNSVAAKKLYARLVAQITDPVSTTEDAIILLQQVIAGTLTSILTSSAAGISLFGSLAIVGPLSGVTTLAMSGAITGVTAPTVTRLLSGTAQTYTSPAGAVRHRVTIVAPGGGAGAQATSAGSNGSADTSFQVNATGTAWTAVKGSGGPSGSASTTGGAGGTGGTDGSTGTKIDRRDGARGSGSSASATTSGGAGGASYGPGAQSAQLGGTGVAAPANGGGGGSGGNGSPYGGGGGGGEVVSFWVTGMTTATYTVGLGGAGGPAGTLAGGAGAAGIIIIEEFYS